MESRREPIIGETEEIQRAQQSGSLKNVQVAVWAPNVPYSQAYKVWSAMRPMGGEAYRFSPEAAQRFVQQRSRFPSGKASYRIVPEGTPNERAE